MANTQQTGGGEMTDILVGTVKGPGEKSHEYLFITSDHKHTKIGEFVFYQAQIDTETRPILGKIVERRLVRSLPDSFLADPQISPRLVSRLIGCELVQPELYEVVVAVTGFYDPALGSFVNPRIPPQPGQQVFLASDDLLAQVLSAKAQGSVGSAHLGSLLTREEGRVPIILRVKELVSTHLAILASTGSGKSYTASVLIEELMRPYNRAAVLVVDPHGEYGTLKAIEGHPAFREGSYTPTVRVFQPEKIKVRLSSLTEADLCYLLPNLSDKMNFFLRQAYRTVTRRARRDELDSYLWGLDDLKEALFNVTNQGRDDGEGKDHDLSTINGLIWRLESRFGKASSVFSDKEHIPLNALFKPGQCTVFQLSEIEQEEQQVIVGTLLRRIYKARLDTTRNRILPSSENYIPYPVFILLEEGHRFAPQGATVVTTSILKTILAEGRKFGVGVGIISQRPGKLDADVLSQCMTQFIMRIVNPIDQSSIASGVEGAGRDLLDELPALSKGQVIVAGAAVNTPVLCRVRKRYTAHGGETLDAPADWLSYFSPTQEQRRQQDTSLLIQGEEEVNIRGFAI
ncbi:MAG: ATP-binding protein [Nitrospinota bacterium]|nr:MAG: ATP-binding protein [Nitrospinota bacterium]